MTYQNIVGQRYLGLSLGKEGTQNLLPPGSVIPPERTEPSFDVTALLNGYEPLFSLFNPHDADNLTKAVIESLQGDTSSMATLVSQTSTLTETFAGRDQTLGEMITNLNKIVGNLAAQNDNLDGVITQAGDMVAELDRRRPELVSSVGSMARVMDRLSTSVTDVYPAAREFIDRQPGATRHMLSIEPQLAFAGDNIPLLMKGLARVRQSRRLRQRLRVRRELSRVLPGTQRCRADHRQCRHAGRPGAVHPEMQEHRRWLTHPCGSGSRGLRPGRRRATTRRGLGSSPSRWSR